VYKRLKCYRDSIIWDQIHKINFYCTIETKLRSFQIKLNFRAIVTNVALHGFGLKDSENCSFCKANPETFMHVFCDYPCVTSYWENVCAFISGILKRN